VKIRGLRIELGEIENRIREYPGVSDCVVVVKHYSESIVLIAAYVVSRSEWQVDDLKDHLRRFLPAYMIPNHFERLDQIPLTPSGKADRKGLPDLVIQMQST
jgi:acyl-coenzyme A synthetase/AMP-(fatty) acid ligase